MAIAKYELRQRPKHIQTDTSFMFTFELLCQHKQMLSLLYLSNF